MPRKSSPLFQSAIVRRAAVDALVKLNPRSMMKNPVMFVVEVGSALTTILLVVDIARHQPGFGFNLQITLWLWFTVLFANFAEAMAEGRGKAQADTLRKAKSETMARRLRKDNTTEEVASALLRVDDIVEVVAGEMIAGDGEVIYGVASVDESAITGESAPVIREAGGDRSAVTGGTRVLSDMIRIRITSNPGETFLDRMIALVEGAERQKNPQRDSPQHPPRWPDDHLPPRRSHPPALRPLLRCPPDRLRPRLPPRLPHPDNHRRSPLGHRHCGHGPPRPAQRPRHVRSRR